MADTTDYSAQRIADLEKQLAAASKTIAARDKALETLTKQADNFTARINEVEAKHAEERSNWEASEALMRAGVSDPEVGEFLRFRYKSEKVAEGAERPAFADWVNTYKESNSALFGATDAKPSVGGKVNAPAAPAIAAPAAPAPAPASPVPPRPIATESGVSTQSAPHGGRFNPREIANMSAEDFKQYRSQILSQTLGRPDSNRT